MLRANVTQSADSVRERVIIACGNSGRIQSWSGFCECRVNTNSLISRLGSALGPDRIPVLQIIILARRMVRVGAANREFLRDTG